MRTHLGRGYRADDGRRRLAAVMSAQWPDTGGRPGTGSFGIHALAVGSYLPDGAYYPVGGGKSFAEHLVPTIAKAGSEVRTGEAVVRLVSKAARSPASRPPTERSTRPSLSSPTSARARRSASCSRRSCSNRTGVAKSSRSRRASATSRSSSASKATSRRPVPHGPTTGSMTAGRPTRYGPIWRSNRNRRACSCRLLR